MERSGRLKTPSWPALKRAVSLPVTERWLGGTLTNFETIKTRLQRLRELRSRSRGGRVRRIDKNATQQSSQHSKKTRLERKMGRHRPNMTALPAGDCGRRLQRREHIAVHEAKVLGIPVIRSNGQQLRSRRRRHHHSGQRRFDPVRQTRPWHYFRPRWRMPTKPLNLSAPNKKRSNGQSVSGWRESAARWLSDSKAVGKRSGRPARAFRRAAAAATAPGAPAPGAPGQTAEGQLRRRLSNGRNGQGHVWGGLEAKIGPAGIKKPPPKSRSRAPFEKRQKPATKPASADSKQRDG